MIYALATISALMFALATALQHRSAQKADQSKAMRPALLFFLALDPMWLLGIGADIVGLFFQFAALVKGSVLVVQAILAIGLVFALFFSAVLHSIRLKASELALSVMTTLALIGFLSFGAPARSIDSSAFSSWLILAVATALLTFVLGVVAINSAPIRRTFVLGVAAGVLHGFTVSLSKVVSQNFVSMGLSRVATDPHTWLLVIMGAVDILVIQSAFQAGPLRVSLPIISVTEPMVAFVISIVVLHESLSATLYGKVVAILALMVMLAGVWGLARITARESLA
ncbi:MAG: DMT family transporter [Acidimicrobiaceae bacterium]|nr:DMT family transporter [Acidimicrobiaceae bacterium]